MRSISTFRTVFAYLATAVLICSIIITAWYPARGSTSFRFDPKQTAPLPTAPALPTGEEKLFLIETQFMYGVVPLLTDYLAGKESDSSTATLLKSLNDGLRSGFIESLNKSLQDVPDAASEAPQEITNLQRKKLIAAVWVGATEAVEKLCYHLINSNGISENPEPTDQILLRSCDNFETALGAEEQGPPSGESDNGATPAPIGATPAPAAAAADAETDEQTPLTLEEYEALKERVGWFAGVYQTTFTDPASPIAQETVEAAKTATQKIARVATTVLMFAFGSLIFGTLLFSRLLRGRLQFRFAQATIHPTLILETFALYLAAMLAMPHVLRVLAQYGITFNALKVNLFVISGLALFVWWPRLWDAATSAIEQSFGLEPRPWAETLRNIAAGPFSYVAAILPLFFLILIYAVVLQLFHVQSGEGAHPIIPVLTETRDTSTIYMIVFMAVVVAPFVEEIMFRGVFYSWLRSRGSAVAAILISSLVFAAVHPQGPIGVVPLTGIGIVLAFLREWRGSLITPMLAHACFNAGTLALALNLLR